MWRTPSTCIGTVAGPHPYPAMVRDFQSVIGNEVREQMLGSAKGGLPDTLVACIGGGSNAMGLFHPFLDDKQRQHLSASKRAADGVETGRARGLADRRPARRAARQPHLSAAGTMTARSSTRIPSPPASTIPASGPEHSWLHEIEAASITSRRPTWKRWRRSSCISQAGRHHSRRWSRRMPWPSGGRDRWRPSLPKDNLHGDESLWPRRPRTSSRSPITSAAWAEIAGGDCKPSIALPFHASPW